MLSLDFKMWQRDRMFRIHDFAVACWQSRSSGGAQVSLYHYRDHLAPKDNY